MTIKQDVSCAFSFNVIDSDARNYDFILYCWEQTVGALLCKHLYQNTCLKRFYITRLPGSKKS